ncbi:MAG TPA: translation elongation factor Ts [Candidatus Saccharimonadia bacterium]|jgi:elongation factor Ts|nr:translation elongation factor Ts [Candidatus Saccharimonadia bacterium]
MAISVDDIKKLRDQTGAGMMKAKEALETAGGDFDKAVKWLREKGEASAAKKSEREARAGLVEGYVHGGRIGVLVEVNCETDFVARTDDFKAFVRDIAMHVAAAAPQYLNPEAVPADVVESERDIYRKEVAGKPAEIIEKIVDGKLNKFYEQVCLVNQPFVKDPDVTIGKLTTDMIAKLGENIVIRRYERMELGGV